MNNKYDKEKILFYILLSIISIWIAFFTLNSSPLIKNYNDIDSSVFIVMGKSMINGKVLYTDVFDHKGPIVYLINALALLISPHIGLFILECILITIGTIYIFKTAKIFLNNYCSIFFSLLYLFFVHLSIGGGNYTEEFSLTFTAIALYYIIQIIHLNQLSKKRNWIIIGATFAINLFIKPTYISIWIAFGITMLVSLIKKKLFKELLLGILYALIGIAMISLPLLMYFIINNNIKDFINAYFILNFKYAGESVLYKLNIAIKLLVDNRYLWYTIFILIVDIFTFKNKNVKIEEKVFSTLFLLVTIFLTIFTNHDFGHYLVQMASAITFPILLFCYSEDIPQSIINIASTFIVIAILIKTYNICCENIQRSQVYSAYTVEALNIIKDKYIEEDDKVLVLGNESNIYIYLNNYPDFKYFFQYPIYNFDDNISAETKKYISEKRPKVIFLRNYMDKVMNLINPYLDENYTVKYIEKFRNLLCFK